MTSRRTLGRALAGGAALAALGSCRDAAAAPVRYTSAAPGSVNTWWVETPGGGLVVIDAQRSYSDAAAALDAIERTGRPVRAVLVTHPHPDHVGGLGLFQRRLRGVPIIAQAATRDEVRDDATGYALMSADLRDGERIPMPGNVIADDASFVVDGLAIESRQLGPGEAAGTTVYWLPSLRTLVLADVATPGFTPFLLEGRTGAWLAQIERVRGAYPAEAPALPGHGEAGALGTMLTQQSDYLTAYRELARGTSLPGSEAGANLSQAERTHVAAEMEHRFPWRDSTSNLPPEQLQASNLDAVRRELKRG